MRFGLFRKPPGVGAPNEAVGGGDAMQPAGGLLAGGVTGYTNPGLTCWKAYHYGERPLPGRVYVSSIPQRAFSEWLR